MPPQQRSSPVISIRPHHALWKEALRQAGGDARRIQVLSPTKLVVHDEPVHR
jgi:hypothetical protein